MKKLMKLYRITYDAVEDWVEAASFGEAVRIWQEAMTARGEAEEGDLYFDEEPEQVVLITDEPIIREAAQQ